MEIDIRDLDVSTLVIAKPKKQVESLFGKITHKDGKAASVFLYNALVVTVKEVGTDVEGGYTIAYASLPKAALTKIAEFDEYVKGHVRSNVSKWFTKSLDENVIDEYYVSSLSVLPSDGCVGRFKIINNGSALADARKCDLLLAIKGIRFFKQRFVAEWELRAVKRLPDDFVNSLLSDESEAEEVDDDVLPSKDILQSISAELLSKVETRMRPLEAELDRLRAIREKLSEDNPVSVLDKIAEDLEI